MLKCKPLPWKESLLVIGKAEQRAAGAGQEHRGEEVRGLPRQCQVPAGKGPPFLCCWSCVALGKSFQLSRPQLLQLLRAKVPQEPSENLLSAPWEAATRTSKPGPGQWRSPQACLQLGSDLPFNYLPSQQEGEPNRKCGGLRGQPTKVTSMQSPVSVMGNSMRTSKQHPKTDCLDTLGLAFARKFWSLPCDWEALCLPRPSLREVVLTIKPDDA